ncbi:MAG TPA: YdcF family protein [Gammaproteobacteria bacterium]|nr:YdcF family protein [Gammaproteobacteria bacterium]
MEILITRGIEAWLLPPGGLLLLIALGLILLRHRRSAVALLLIALISLAVFSLPVTGKALMRQLEIYPALAAQDFRSAPAQAIVVLAGGRYADAPEYGGDTVSTYSLERLRYGMWLHKQTGLPLLLTGGDPFNEGSSEASLMRKVLLEDYHIEAWTEDASTTTAGNAFLSKHLLEEKNIDTVYLVTSAWHMRRAVRIFEQAGLRVIPAPTHFLSLENTRVPPLLNWLPQAHALEKSNLALHELLGDVWYRLRY